jgi:hypothetical protein
MQRAATCGLSGRSNRGQIPGLMLDPCEHPGEDHKGGDDCGNNHGVYGWHDIPLFVILPSREEPSFDLDQ